MAVSLVGIVTGISSASAVTVVWPTHQAGDLIVIGISARQATDTAVTVSSGGATLLSTVNASNVTSSRRRLQVAYKFATTSSEPNIVFSDAGQINVVCAAVYRGATPGTLAWLATTDGQDNAGGTALHIPTGGTATAGAFIVGVLARAYAASDDVGTWVNADLSGVAEDAYEAYTGGSGGSLHIVSGSGAPSSGLDNFTTTMVNGTAWSAGAIELIPTGTPDPAITDVDTDETVLAGQTGVAVTGTTFGTTNADRDFHIVQGAVAVLQTETGTGTSTAATLTIGIEQSGADIKHGAAKLRITRDSDSADGDIDITVNPASGHIYVDVGTPATDGDDRITASPDIASGDQIEARGVGGGAIPTGLNIYADATFDFDLGETPAAFDVRVWDASDSTWGAWATQGIAGGAVTGTGATTTPAVTASGTAASGQVASGATTTPATTASGTAEVTNTSSGATTTPAATASGTAERAIPGSGATTTPTTTASGSGIAAGAGSAFGAASTPKVTASGTAERTVGSTATAFVPAVTASGSAIRVVTGSGACVTPKVTASGYDVPPVSSGGRGVWGRLRLGLGLGL